MTITDPNGTSLPADPTDAADSRGPALTGFPGGTGDTASTGHAGPARGASTPALAAAGRLLVESLGARPVGLQSFGVRDADRSRLAGHLGRVALQACPGRDFRKAWRTDTAGNRVPRYLKIGTPSLARCQYAVLTHPQRSTVLIIDVDRPGNAGGMIEDLDVEVRRTLALLAGVGAGPAWIGVNPLRGTAQLLWLIDPVYADGAGDSSNIRLLRATTRILGDAVGGDPAFAHSLSRSPFYTGDDPAAYRWHVQHHRIDRLADLIKEARAMTGEPAPGDAAPRQQFASGRELLEAVQARRAQAEAFKAMAENLDGELPSADAMDTDRIDGVRVLWISEGRAARDETAFRHALATAHRMRAAGQRLKDAKIIDAYERGYAVAQAVGADGRVEDLPAMSDRLTMARRVRGYVIAGKTSVSSAGGPSSGARATGRERKALATLGRKGGKKSAQRWVTDPDSEYATRQREKLEAANRRKRVNGQTTRARIQAIIGQQYAELGTTPTWREIMDETGLSRRTVARHISALRDAGMLPE